MKGLLVKDFIFMRKNKKMVIMLLAIEIIFLATQGVDSAPFIIGYMTMGCGMLVLSSITTDEYTKSMPFLMALPISRKEYVLEKYIFSVICNLFGCLLAFLPCCMMKPAQTGEVLGMAMVILAVMLLVQMAMLPAQLKYGGEKGRGVLMGVFVCIVLAVTLLKKGGKALLDRHEGLQLWLGGMLNGLERMDNLAFAAGAAVLCVIGFGISYAVSRGIMEKKEF